jgi:hypothetical protein
MTLEEIYYISQIVAVIGIFASLIFVGVQIRQNSEQMKAQTREAHYGAMNQILTDWHQAVTSISRDPLAAQDYFKGHSGGLAAIAPERRAAYVIGLVGNGHLYERAWIQRQAGRLSDDAWEVIQRQHAAMITGIGYQEVWKLRKASFSTGFVAFLDKEIASAPVVSYETLSVS